MIDGTKFYATAPFNYERCVPPAREGEAEVLLARDSVEGRAGSTLTQRRLGPKVWPGSPIPN